VADQISGDIAVYDLAGRHRRILARASCRPGRSG
jgi:hypothetical protein